jgi:cytoskeletal protein CcmA (bactofilin family)
MAFSASKRTDSDGYNNYSPANAESRSFFGKTMRIQGEISSEEDLTIEGKVTGQLEIGKTLTVGKEGFVSGDITASVVHISGVAEGRVNASGKLDISAHGTYNGHIKADTIVVAEGAKLRGTINIDEEFELKPTQPVEVDTKDEPVEEIIDASIVEEEKEEIEPTADTTDDNQENEKKHHSHHRKNKHKSGK